MRYQRYAVRVIPPTSSVASTAIRLINIGLLTLAVQIETRGRDSFGKDSMNLFSLSKYCLQYGAYRMNSYASP